MNTATGCLLFVTIASNVQSSIFDRHAWKDRVYSSLHLSNDYDRFVQRSDDVTVQNTKSTASTIGSINVDLGDGEIQSISSQRWIKKNSSIYHPLVSSMNSSSVIGHKRQTYTFHPPTDRYRSSFPTSVSRTDQDEPGAITISMDPAAMVRLLSLIGSSATSISAAFMGTLRLLAPM